MIRKTLTFAVALAGLVIPATAQAAPVCSQGDPPIQTSTHTSCAFAGRLLDTYYNYGADRSVARFRVYSPTTHRSYPILYRRTGQRYGATVTATGPNGIWARFGVDL